MPPRRRLLVCLGVGTVQVPQEAVDARHLEYAAHNLGERLIAPEGSLALRPASGDPGLPEDQGAQMRSPRWVLAHALRLGWRNSERSQGCSTPASRRTTRARRDISRESGGLLAVASQTQRTGRAAMRK